MASVELQDRIDRFDAFFRAYYDDEIAELAQHYPAEQRSLWIDWRDLYRFDENLAGDVRSEPEELLADAEEALRLYDLPVDVTLDESHVRVLGFPETTDIRDIRAEHVNKLVAVRGIVRKSTGVKPRIEQASFECQRCGTVTQIPQDGGDFQEPHQCQGCERKGPFRLDEGQSTFVDAQRLRVQESPEGLRGGQTPESIDVHIEDDITGLVSPGDHVRATGILRLEQQGNAGEKSTLFDVYMEGVTVEPEEEQFDEMEITAEDEAWIIEQSDRDDIYDRMVESIAPSIYGYENAKLAMVLQLFSGVTKDLPDGSRTRGDMHMLLIGDPGTGKCQRYDTEILLPDRNNAVLGDLVESRLDDPVEIDDGWYQRTAFPVMSFDGATVRPATVTRVWKREAPETMYRITTTAGNELEVTPSHPLFTVQEGRVVAIEAAELSTDTYLAAPVCDGSIGADANNVEALFDQDVVPDVATLIRAIRRFLGVGRSNCGLSSDSFGAIEAGDRHPTRDELRTIITAFEEVLASRRRVRAGSASAGDAQSGLESQVVVRPDGGSQFTDGQPKACEIDGGDDVRNVIERLRKLVEAPLAWNRIESIEAVEADDEWVYDLEVEGTHTYISEGVLSHNSALLQYVRNIAPRSVYTSGKGSSAAGLTAAAVRDDFGDGQQWSLEAGALVLADQGIAAIDELDKMRCVTGETVVELADGSARIEELARRAASDGTIESHDNGRTIRGIDLRVRTMDDAGRIVTRPVEAIHEYQPPDAVIQMTLEDGSSIRTTPDHPVLTRSRGHRFDRPAERVRPGHRVYAPRGEVSARPDGGIATETGPKNRPERDVTWKQVTAVERIVSEQRSDTDVEAVYDLSVAGTRNYVANGMVVHNSEDRSAMHEALEAQEISISKAGINATLKARCSLLGAANPTYGRFDPYEPVGEQIDLEPALISRFDLIFTVTDQPDEDEDRALAEHILETNYAGELTTRKEALQAPDVTDEEIEAVSGTVTPAIQPERFRKYVAFAQQSCFPRMTDEARQAIEDFYVDLRLKGTDEDAPVPVTARKLEGLVRLAEASARIRLSDTVERSDADRVIELVRSCLQDIGVDPETGQYDADVVETGHTKTQRDRVRSLKEIIRDLQGEHDEGAPREEVLSEAEAAGIDRSKAEHQIQKLRDQGEVYSPQGEHFRLV